MPEARSSAAGRRLVVQDRSGVEDGLQLLKVSNEDHKGLWVELGQGRLKNSPDMGIDLRDLIENDQVVAVKSPRRYVLLVCGASDLEARMQCLHNAIVRLGDGGSRVR